MAETLGRRIAAHRKTLGLTQDQLAEKLGVTAQAVSKWENDQSCPDITTLPRLAAIFDITTDALLGVESRQMTPAVQEKEPDSDHTFEIRFDDENKGKNFEFRYDAGRRGGIELALWIILTAALLILSEVKFGPASFWSCLWTSGLLVFGLFGLYPKFSPLRLGCALLGGYNLLSWWMPIPVNEGLWLAFFLLLLGVSILTDSLRKKGPGHIIFSTPNMANKLDIDGEAFHCATAFGNEHHRPQMELLSSGTGEVSFGEMTIDLSGCKKIAQACPIQLKCAFGKLCLLIPKGCRAELQSRKAFGNVAVRGTPAGDARTILRLDCDASFGEISIQYL